MQSEGAALLSCGSGLYLQTTSPDKTSLFPSAAFVGDFYHSNKKRKKNEAKHSILPVNDPGRPGKRVRYCLDPESPAKSCKSRGSYLPVYFRSTCETAQAIKGIHIRKATKYLKDVTLKKQCIWLQPHNGGVGGRA